MQKKIIDKKDFNDFMGFMLDESVDVQNKRIKIYKEYGGLSPESKAKYIVDKLGSYIYKIVSEIEELEDDDVDNSGPLEEMQLCFTGIKKMLKAEEQLEAFDEVFKSLNFQKKFNDLENLLVLHKKDIYSFTNNIFSSIMSNLSDSKPPSLLDFKELITSEEIYNYVVKKDNNSLSEEGYNIGKMIISALNREKSSVNAEIVGRVYAYVKSGWAEADLFEKSTIDNETVQKLNSVVENIIKNNLSFTTSDKEKNDENLAKFFTERLNQISINIVYDKDNQSCHAESADFNPSKVAKSGTADVVIPYYKNPSTLLQVYCTANEALYFTADNQNSWSVLSHQKINDKYLIGKSVKNIDVDSDVNENRLSKNLNKGFYENKIENIEVINISPAILGNKKVLEALRDVFKNPGLSIREKSLINNFPIFNIISKYKPDDKRGESVTIKNILNIKENIILNDSYDNNPWNSFAEQIKLYKPTSDKLEHFYYNRFLVPYIDELWNIIQNKGFKEDFIISNIPTNNKLGKALFFIKEFPEFFSNIIDVLSRDENEVLFTKNSRDIIVKIATELGEHSIFNSSKSLETLRKPMKAVKNDLRDIIEQEEFNNTRKEELKKVKSIIKRK